MEELLGSYIWKNDGQNFFALLGFLGFLIRRLALLRYPDISRLFTFQLRDNFFLLAFLVIVT